MADYTFQVFDFDQFAASGADPFADPAYTNPAAIGTTITIAPTGSWSTVTVSDDEAMLHDNDAAPQQALVDPVVLNGTTYLPGTHVETEYSYVIRPAGSSDPADNFTIQAVSMDGVVIGFASSQPLTDGASYTIIAADSESPTVLYNDLVVCFAAGTRIATPSGARAIETLRPGDRVLTLDNGAQPIVWVGAQRLRGAGAARPVVISREITGGQVDLVLSRQHRVLIPDRGGGKGDGELVPVKALIGAPGVWSAPRARIAYYHILMERHELVWAEGALAETLWPGKSARRALGRAALAEIRDALPGFAPGRWSPARHLLRPSNWNPNRARFGLLARG